MYALLLQSYHFSAEIAKEIAWQAGKMRNRQIKQD